MVCFPPIKFGIYTADISSISTLSEQNERQFTWFDLEQRISISVSSSVPAPYKTHTFTQRELPNRHFITSLVYKLVQHISI